MNYESNMRDVFLRVVVFFLAFGWLVSFFAATGLFYRETILLSIIASFAIFLYISQKKKLGDAKHFGKSSIFVLLIALAASLATCYFATPTVFGGRDQGSIATAAIYLSRNHKTTIESPIARGLFQKYGTGKALNYPGFDYTADGKLVSRFPIGYTAYLASAHSFFGLKGIQYANAIPLFLFLALFWMTLREFFSEKKSFLGFLLAATFFPFLWFAKYSLTETYALFLVWAGIYFLISSLKDSTPKNPGTLCLKIVLALAAFGLSALVRIEGIVFFLLAAAYILTLQKKKIIEAPKNLRTHLLVSAALLVIIYVFLNLPSLSDSAKNIAKSLVPGTENGSAPRENLYLHLVKVFSDYNILAYFLLGLAGIGWLAKNNKKNRLSPEFIPVIITFPAFFYLVSPMITLDDPWMLRRFTFAVFPALLFYSVYFLKFFFHHKKLLYAAFIFLIAANAAVSSRFLTLSENKDLLPQIEKISQKFGPRDLVLVDRVATGSGWSLMSEPLAAIYGKNAVYFFNADDLKTINQSHFDHVYLIAPPAEEKSWYYGLTEEKPSGTIPVYNNFLEPSDGFLKLAINIKSSSFVNIWKLR